MALESIGGAGSMNNYADVVKQTVNKAPQVQAPEDVVKKAAPVTPAAVMTTSAVPVSTEAKGAGAEGQEDEAVSRKMKDAIDKVNQKIVPTKTRCEFSYHEETKRVSIKVIDQNTEEVIKEIPPEEALDMLSKVWELAGLLVDERR